MNLPAILQRNNSTLSQRRKDNDLFEIDFVLRLDSGGEVNGLFVHSMTPTDPYPYQRMLKIGETSIARRERRTQELQKNRLMKTLFH